MASIKKMTHKSVTAEFTMEEWTLSLDAMRAALAQGHESGLSQEQQVSLVRLLKSISPAPWKSRNPLSKPNSRE